MIVEGFGALGVRSGPGGTLVTAVARHLVRDNRLLAFAPRDLAGLVWGFAALRVSDDGLLDAVAEQITQEGVTLAPWDIARTAWAYATLGIQNADLLAQRAEQSLQDGFVFNFTSPQVDTVPGGGRGGGYLPQCTLCVRDPHCLASSSGDQEPPCFTCCQSRMAVLSDERVTLGGSCCARYPPPSPPPSVVASVQCKYTS